MVTTEVRELDLARLPHRRRTAILISSVVAFLEDRTGKELPRGS